MSIHSLNAEQVQAVKHFKGPMVVLAGPGSGKTTVITHRINNLICERNIMPRNILVITFSKSSADEMESRFNNIFNNGEKSYVVFGTFHSLFFRILRSYYDYKLDNIIKNEHKKMVLMDISYKLGIEINDEEDYFSTLVNEISFIKNELIDIEDYVSKNMPPIEFRQVYNLYEEYKLEHNLLDFDDMLVKCYHLLNSNEKILQIWRNKFEFILIDEFQDINYVQYMCIKLLMNDDKNIFIVGDDDQSIYKFRGARPEFLINFRAEIENVKTIVLNINYRSTDEIINISNAIISGNDNRYEKIIKGTEKGGNRPKLLTSKDIKSEADFIGEKILKIAKNKELNKIAIIFRTNIQARAFVDALMDRNISFQLKDSLPSIYEHWVSKDIFAYISLAYNRNDNKAFMRIANKPKRYISKSLMATYNKSGNSMLEGITKDKDIKIWLRNRVEDLTLQLNGLKKKKPYDAIKYIRKTMEYDLYILDYANYRKVKPAKLFEVLDEIAEGAKEFETMEMYLSHVDQVIRLTKEQMNSRDRKKNNGVVLTTMHSAKGLEFDIVFIAGAVEGVIPYEKSKSKEEIEEERRLFYVGITRAKEELYISTLETRYENKVDKTRFLNDIIKKSK